MKNTKKLLAVAAALATMLAFTQVSCSKGGGKLAGMIGKDAQFVVMIPEIGKATANLGSLLDGLAAKSPGLGGAKQQLTSMAGFDPTNADELAKKGINPKGGMAIVMSDMQSQDGYAMLAIKDKDAFMEFLKSMGLPEMQKEGDYYTSPMGGFLTFKKGLAIFGSKKETLESVGKGDSLADSDDYKTASKNAGNGDVIMYFSPAFMDSIAQQSGARGAEAEAMKSITKMYGASCTALSLSANEIEAKSFVQLTDMENVKKIMASSSASDMMGNMPAGAPLLAKFQLNIAESWTFIKDLIASTDPNAKKEMEDGLKQGGQVLGMDIEKDVIGNMEGNPVFAFYGMTGRRNETPDMIATIMLKDEAKIKKALETIAQMMPVKKPQLADSGVTELQVDRRNVVYVIVKNNHLIITLTPERMKDIIAVLGGSGSKAIDQVTDKDIKGLLGKKEANVLYLNIGMLLDVIKKGLSNQEAQMMNMVVGSTEGYKDSYLLVKSDVEDDGVVGSIKISLGK